MACRCADLEIYKADKAILEDVQDKIYILHQKNDEIEETLVKLGNIVPETVVIPDDTFSYKARCVNNKSTGAIGMMNYHVSQEMAKLDKEIDEASKEDFEYHLTHPNETLVSWLGG